MSARQLADVPRPGSKCARALEMALVGTPPAVIQAELNLTCARDVLSHYRRIGYPIPRHSTAPLNPKMPDDRTPVFATPQARAAMARRVVALIDAGLSQRSAAATLKLSLGNVQRLLKHHETHA